MKTIEHLAFYSCSSLMSITIPSSVEFIGYGAFFECSNLSGVYFRGDAPGHGMELFEESPRVSVYYKSDSSGWASRFGGRQAILWNPGILTSDGNFGLLSGKFGFTISGHDSELIKIETCTSLETESWQAVSTTSLTASSAYFSDPDWIDHPKRFYRLSMP